VTGDVVLPVLLLALASCWALSVEKRFRGLRNDLRELQTETDAYIDAIASKLGRELPTKIPVIYRDEPASRGVHRETRGVALAGFCSRLEKAHERIMEGER